MNVSAETSIANQNEQFIFFSECTFQKILMALRFPGFDQSLLKSSSNFCFNLNQKATSYRGPEKTDNQRDYDSVKSSG